MNLSQLQTAIQDKGYAADTATQQIGAINSVYRQVCGIRRWPFLEKQSTSITTVVGTPSYSLAAITDLQDIDAVRIEVGTEYDPTEYLSPQDFRDLEHADRDPGTPYYWTFINQTLHFYPRPDSIYTVTIDYIVTPADLAAPTDVPVLPSIFHDVLVWGACSAIAYRQRDWLGRQFAREEFQLRLAQMGQNLRQRQTSSHVKSSGYWGSDRSSPWAGGW